MKATQSLQAARRALQQGFRWWIGTLGEMLPAGVQAILAPAKPALGIEIGAAAIALRDPRADPSAAPDVVPTTGTSSLANTLAEAVAARVPPGSIVEAKLGPDLVFRRRVVLPAGGVNDLLAILAHEIDRLTPLDAASASHDARLLARDAEGRLTAELVVAERSLLEAVLEGAKRATVTLAAVGLADDAPDGRPIDLARGLHRRPRGWRRIPAIGVLAFGTGVALILAILVRLDRQDTAIETARAEMTRLRIEARTVEDLARKVAALEARAAALAAERSRPAPIVLLGDLADRLPDGSWIGSLFLNQKELRFSGWSMDAARLPPLLDASPHLEAVRFGAPVTRDGVLNLDRFELSATLSQGAGR